MYNTRKWGDNMALLESGENYLETIYMLSKTKDGLHAIDLVNHLGYSKPSVSIMLKKLADDNYLYIDNNNHIILTDKGSKIAKKIYERHKILKEFIIKLGVSEATAEEDACKIEHDLSDETINAIKKYMKQLS